MQEFKRTILMLQVMIAVKLMVRLRPKHVELCVSIASKIQKVLRKLPLGPKF